MATQQTAGHAPAPSVFARVTDLVLAELAKGTAPWRKPWQVDFGLPRNMLSGKAYRGVNVLTLMTTALAVPYPHNLWLTFNQAKERGAHVKQGEHGVPIMFYKKALLDAEGEVVDEADAGASTVGLKWRPILKVYTVFNIAQCAGIAQPSQAPLRPLDAVASAEQIVQALGVPVRYEGTQAYYQPKRDLITLPPRASFESPSAFYGTLLHELVHATGHQARLDRPYGRFGDEAYAWEELIAEMGSAMLAVITGVPCPDFPNIAAYVGSWHKKLTGDDRAISEAAAAAQRAVEWLLNAAHLPLPG